MVLALPATLALWRRGRGDPILRLSLLVFGLCLAACYAASALFHGVRGPDEHIEAFARLDLIGIYLLIAGTYTPAAWGLLRGRWRRWTLTAVWSVASSAAALLWSGAHFPLPLSTALYLAMGWGSVACYVEITRSVSRRALRPLILGGLLYSVGAIINLVRWPAPWPGVFGAHEIFHLFVLAGSASHVHFMLTVVIPFAGMAGAVATGRGDWAPSRRRDGAWDDVRSPVISTPDLKLVGHVVPET
jgi:hemolysin III